MPQTMQRVSLFLNAHLDETFSKGIIHIVCTQDFWWVSINYPVIRRRTSACKEVRDVAFSGQIRSVQVS